MGLCAGLLIHTTAVALSVAAVFQASAIAFTVLKIVGVLYLLYLACQASRASAVKFEPNKENRLGSFQLYLRGIIMNITNPEVSIFFLAYLPQFVDPSHGGISIQIYILGALFIVATMLVFGNVAFLSGILGQWLSQSPKKQLVMNWVAGTVLASLAIGLVVTER